MSLILFREPNKVKWIGVRPGHRGVQVVKSQSANNANSVIHTVSAGKTFYLTNLWLSAYSTVAGLAGYIFVRDELDAYQYNLNYFNLALEDSLADSVSPSFPLEFPSGWDICLVSSGAGLYARGGIWGWEE